VTDRSPTDTAAGFTYSWNFGDGSTSTQAAPGHVYAVAGNYTVSQTVRDKDGGSGTATASVTVAPQTVSQSFPNNLAPPPLPAPTGTVVNVSTVSQLQTAVANLQSGQTILIAPGTYTLTGPLYVPQNRTNIAIRGASGKAGDVVIQGDAVLSTAAPYTGSAIWGAGSGISGTVQFGIWLGNVQGVTIGDLTLKNFTTDAIILNAGVQSPLIHNVVMLDAGEQLLKSNPDGAGGGVNNGVVEYCTIGYTTAAPNNYTNGVDLHTSQNWVIRNNLFKNILTTNPLTTYTSGALAGPAILVWNGSKNTTVVGNAFINCQREIAFGLTDPSGITNDNSGGIIANNMIYRSGGQHGDVAIAVWNSPGSEVANNTVILSGDYANAVEYRFATTTGVKILYNLTDAPVTARDGATGTVTGNVTSGAQASWFVNKAAGDLHLTSAATGAIGKGQALTEDRTDYDGQARPSSGAADVGADQYQAAAPTPPRVTAVTPANAATGVATSGNVQVTFSEALGPATVTTGTVQLLDATGAAVAATVSYNATTFTATLTPGSALASSSTYTVLVHGGTTGAVVKDTAGDPLAANFSSSFTTAVPAAAPVANAGPGKSGNEGAAVNFAGSVSGGQPALSYAWAFGDGGTATGTLTPAHVYADNGTYSVTLTVTDSLGRSSSASTTATIANVAPTPDPGGPYSGAPGAAIALSGSATDAGSADTTAGFQWLWNFGDGSTSTARNPSHAFAAAGTYTVSLAVTDKDGGSASATTTVTVQSASFNSSPTITTSYLTIPNFGAKPTITSIKSGNWSDPTVWSLGRLPGAGDVVDVNPGTTVTYDVNSAVALNTLEVQATGTLTFRTDVTTQLVVGNFLVLEGGSLVIGTAANPIAANVEVEIDFANQPINTAVDPQQFGTGLIVLGNVTMHGATKTPYATLAQEPRAGDTALHLASPVTGWQAGDDPVLPDTRQLTGHGATGYTYQPQWERVTVQSVSADGLTVNLTAPLKYNHLGARDANGVLGMLPQVMNDSRNIMFESQSMTGTRGYTLYTGRANVDIEYAGFCELGRSTGSNQADRYAMTMLDLIGPAAPQANGHQFTLIGNQVDNDGDGNASNPSNLIWGIALNNSHYGLIQSNTVWAVYGAGIGVEDAASSYNTFDRNFVGNVTGTSNRYDLQLQGNGFWFHNPNNSITNNVAVDINGASYDVFSYGYDIDASTGSLGGGVGTVAVPAFQGADPSQPGQSKQVNMNDTPLLQFAGNTVYGATPSGMTLWWIGTYGDTPYADAQTSVVKNFTAWNFSTRGIYGYPTNNVVIDGAVIRGDASQLNNQFNYVTGITFDDYMTHNLVIQNSDVQGMATGIAAPFMVGRTATMDTTLIQNCKLNNTVNIELSPPRSVNGSSGLAPMTLNVTNVTFAHPSAAPSSWWLDISLDYITSDSLGTSNFGVPQYVYVYNYNGVVGDNFQVFYSNNHPAGTTTRQYIGGYVLKV
jgi:PKD repeat protein